MNATSLASPCELADHVRQRTNWRIRNLVVEVADGRAVLRGRASTWFVKQLAQHAVFDFMPHLRVDNAIDVEHGEFVAGLPLS